MTTADQIETREVTWLWDGWLPRGYAGVLEGDPGVGKSTLAAWLVGELTRQGHNVLYLAGEDGLAEQLIPRLRAANADLSRVTVRLDGYNDNEGPVLPGEAKALRDAIKKHQIAFVVLDNIDHFAEKISTKAGSNLLMQVAGEIARENNCSILFLRHLVKGKGKAIHRGAGSIGIFGGARFVWLLAFQPGSKTPCLVCSKLTVAPPPTGRLWRMEGTPEHNSARMVFDRLIEIDADAVSGGVTKAGAAMKKVRTVAGGVRDVKTIISGVKMFTKLLGK